MYHQIFWDFAPMSRLVEPKAPCHYAAHLFSAKEWILEIAFAA